MSLPITPETKVGALLEAYPQLQATLIEIAPAFAKLKNPVLRKTVAKVASLEQAARVGGVPLPELLARLRSAAGVNAGDVSASEAPAGPQGQRPEWATESAHRIDAERLLQGGVHPLGQIRQALANTDVVLVETTFYPAPLVDVMRREGLDVWCDQAGPLQRTWIHRAR